MIETTSQRHEAGNPPDRVVILDRLHDPFYSKPGDTLTQFLKVYLDHFATTLGVTAADIDRAELTGMAARSAGQAGSSGDKVFPLRQGAYVVLIQQTSEITDGNNDKVAVPVDGAGFRVIAERLEDGRWVVRGAVSTFVTPEWALIAPQVDLSKIASTATVRAVAQAAGLQVPNRETLTHMPVLPVMHRYRGPVARKVGDQIFEPGKFYPATIFRLPSSVPTEVVAWIKWQKESHAAPVVVPLSVTQLTAHAMPSGLILECDPVCASGDRSIRPSASPDDLRPFRTTVSLAGLNEPPPASLWRLESDRIELLGGSPWSNSTQSRTGQTDALPPKSNSGVFNYEVRTNEFAAVNSYYHVESMLALLDRFDLPLASFPLIVDGVIDPKLQVIPRAAITPGSCHDGNCVNAQAMLLVDDQPGRLQLRFALADLQRSPGQPDKPIQPLGIACDVRVVWHEFGHILIAAATNYLELPFVHSTGDALAAIMGDPPSKLGAIDGLDANPRFDTYPWGTTPNRRHDRLVDEGWSWVGPMGTEKDYQSDLRDPSGYAREQVLSTTLFRFYRAIGGDAMTAGRPDIVRRTDAAEYAAFLIVGALKMQGSATIVPAVDAATFLLALRLQDAHTTYGPPPRRRVGGTLIKVLKWAFERQGLPPVHFPDTIPLPDIFIADDHRNGSYPWMEHWHARPEGIWNRTAADGGSGDQVPIGSAKNYLYVAVKNCGHAKATSVEVEVFVVEHAFDAMFPNPFMPWQNLAAPALPVPNDVDVGATRIFGPFEWTPKPSCKYTILAIANCPGDPSNTLPSSGLPCSKAPTPLEDLVRFDNNLAARVFQA